MPVQQNEIGGFFSLENYGVELYHKNAILLNSARNALRYIIRTFHIKEIYIPYYTCPVVIDSIAKENCQYQFYDIDSNFLPVLRQPTESFLLYTDYFGICTENVKTLEKKNRKMIVDNAQSFFSTASGIACFYSPRKFFGLPDGGIAVTNRECGQSILEEDLSYERMSHLIKRPELGAEVSYTDFKENDSKLDNLPIKKMSSLTRLLMGNINYKRVKRKRRENFAFLHNVFNKINKLKINFNNKTVPMVYPLLIERPELRKKLINNKIYVAKYWEGLSHIIPYNSYSNYLVENLIPLPIDQRYNLKDMNRILEVIHG